MLSQCSQNVLRMRSECFRNALRMLPKCSPTPPGSIPGGTPGPHSEDRSEALRKDREKDHFGQQVNYQHSVRNSFGVKCTDQQLNLPNVIARTNFLAGRSNARKRSRSALPVARCSYVRLACGVLRVACGRGASLRRVRGLAGPPASFLQRKEAAVAPEYLESQ